MKRYYIFPRAPLTGALPYQIEVITGHSLRVGESYPSTEMQSVYFVAELLKLLQVTEWLTFFWLMYGPMYKIEEFVKLWIKSILFKHVKSSFIWYRVRTARLLLICQSLKKKKKKSHVADRQVIFGRLAIRSTVQLPQPTILFFFFKGFLHTHDIKYSYLSDLFDP